MRNVHKRLKQKRKKEQEAYKKSSDESTEALEKYRLMIREELKGMTPEEIRKKYLIRS